MLSNYKFLFLFFLAIPTISHASRSQHDELCYNFDRTDLAKNEIVQPSMIVVNYTVEATLEKSIESFKKARVSIHYIIDKDGTIYEAMHETPKSITTINQEYLQRRAWHAGHAYWNGAQEKISDINSYSIGIVFVNEGALPKDTPSVLTNNASNSTQWFDFTSEQENAFVNICQQLKSAYNIADKDIVGHGEVAINPTTKSLGRKIGAGPKFPWKASAQKGVGLYHNLNEEELTQPCLNSISDLQKSLLAWGYSVQKTGIEDNQTQQALVQAQIHHDSKNIDGDVKSCRMVHIMNSLLAQANARK